MSETKYTPKPSGTNLFIEEFDVKPVSASGLSLPDSMKQTFFGVAFAGSDATLTVGTIVIPSVKKSLKARVGDTTYIVCAQEDLLGIIEVEEANEDTTKR